MPMLAYQVKIEFYKMVCAFIYISTSCMRSVKALSNLRICADTSEPSLHADAICTEIVCVGPLFSYEMMVILSCREK